MECFSFSTVWVLTNYPSTKLAPTTAQALKGTSGQHNAAQRMPPKPKTINDFKAALLKLKVSLPAKNAKLGEYDQLWTSATTTPAPEATAAPPSAPRSKRKAPAVASKSPAAQRPRRSSTGGASTPVPPSAAGQAHVDRMVSSRASPNMPLSQQRASSSVPLNQRRSPAAAVPLSQQRASPNVPLSQQRPALVPIPLQPPAAATPAAVPWYMPQPAFGTAASTGFPAFGFGGGARATLPSTADAPLPSYSFGGEGEDAAAAEPAGARAGARARRALARLAPTRRALLAVAAAAAAVGLLSAVAVLGVPALPVLPALPSAGGMVDALRALPQRGLHALLRLAASGAAFVAHGAWWLLRLLPQLVTRGLSWVWALPRNEKVGGLVTLAALFFLHRAFVWYERCRHLLSCLALTHSPTHLLTHSPTHLLTYSPTHLLTLVTC